MYQIPYTIGISYTQEMVRETIIIKGNQNELTGEDERFSERKKSHKLNWKN